MLSFLEVNMLFADTDGCFDRPTTTMATDIAQLMSCCWVNAP